MKKITILILLLMTVTLLGNINWTRDFVGNQKPILLYISDPRFPGKSIERAFKESKVIKLIQEHYTPIKVKGLIDRDFVNRFGYIVPPSVAILSKEGLIIDLERNLTPILMHNFLLKNIERANDPTDYAIQRTEKQFYLPYHSNNRKKVYNRDIFLEQKLIDGYQFKFGHFQFTAPSIQGGMLLSALRWGSIQLQWILHHQIDRILAGDICTTYCFNRARRGWKKPFRYGTLKNNALFARVLLKRYQQSGDHYYLDRGKKIVAALSTDLKGGYIYRGKSGNLNDLSGTIEAKITELSYLIEAKKSHNEVLKQLKSVLIQSKNHRLLSVRVSVLKGLFFLSQIKMGSLKAVTDYEAMIQNQFFNKDQLIYNDVVHGKEPFGFLWFNPKENIDFAIIQFQLAALLDHPAYFVSGKNILAFLQNIPGDHLLFTSYIEAYSRFEQLKDHFKVFLND